MSIDVSSLWDFRQPEISEQRFRTALAQADGDDRLILQTQIARSYGLRKDFETAERILKEIEPAVDTAGPEAQVRYYLELGRSLASATHSPEQLTPANRARARAAYENARSTARAAELDGLLIDAIHMFAFLDSSPADQLKWGQEALTVALASSQPEAKRWQASIRHNVGYALHQLGRFEEALSQFQEAATLREKGQDAAATRVAWWMIAWTLRSLGREDEALDIQLRLEREADVAGKPDPYVFEELEILYRARRDTARADFYAQRRLKASEPMQ